jgi:hypothetical protein
VKTAAWYNTRLIVAPLVLALGLAPAVALAQSAPPGLPSYAAPQAAPPAPQPVDQETIHGSIASTDNNNGLQLNDDRGFVDSVQIQPNTIINPDGTRLKAGMVVTIGGAAQGSFFAANHIDVAMNGPQGPPPQNEPQGPPQQNGPQGPPPQYGQQGTPPQYTPQGPQQDGDAYVQPPPVPLKSGMELSGILGTPLDSKTATVGEPVDLTNVIAANGSINGASLLGTVVDVQHPGPGRNAQIMLHFDTLQMPDGSTTPIDGMVVSMKIKTKSNAAKELGGAVVGMLVGNALGKTLLGVSGGGIVGAFGGYLVAKDDRTDITIPANTGVTVRLVHERRQSDSSQ